MTCEFALSSLDAWNDGSLDPAAAELVEAHLAKCPACRDEFTFSERLRSEATALPAEIAPPVDLWPGITGGLKRPLRYTPWLAAAAIAVLALGAALIRQPARGGPAQDDSIVALEMDYRNAAAELQRTVEANRSALGPETVMVVDRNVRIAEMAIADLKLALQEDPEDPGLTRMLLSAWDHKLDLLRRAAAVTTET